MKRYVKDINTPEHYDELYFGPRTTQLLAHDYLIDTLKSLIVPDGQVLDIGCGIGRYFPAFEGMNIHGTELSLKAINEAKRLYPKADVFQWFAGTFLPFEDNYFDLIWAGEFLEHLDDPPKSIDEIYRVLKPNGNAVFVTPVGQSSRCPEHLWFFDDKDINSFFDKYEKKVISKIKDNTRYFIVLGK